MLPREKTILVIDELKPLLSGGATFQSIYRLLYFTRLFKYIPHTYYKNFKDDFSKIATKSKLKMLCELGYLKEVRLKVFIATQMSVDLVKQAGFFVKYLPKLPEGEGKQNALNNTKIFIQATHLEGYKQIFFPDFPNIGLEPDGLLFQMIDNKYRLVFLEIENGKPDWENYINRKKEKYLLLSKDLVFYNYWKRVCKDIELPIPTTEQFKFSVNFVCSLNKQFGNGFRFITSLTNEEVSQ